MSATPLHSRVAGMMRSAGMDPEPWQVESLAASLITNDVQPTDKQMYSALMAAPWHPKPRRRHWRVGEGGGWAVRS